MQSLSCQSWYFIYMKMQSSSCQSWYFVWVFGYENEELILPKLVLCLEFWIRRCRAHLAKVGTLSGFLEMRMQRASCQSWSLNGFLILGCRAHTANVGWYFFCVFLYEDAEVILPKLVLCLGVWIWRCRAHLAKS